MYYNTNSKLNNELNNELNKNVLIIEKIVTVFYRELVSSFVFKGESHDFWEIVYVDKGELEVVAGTIPYTLKKGDIIFHKPNEFHSLFVKGEVPPNAMIVSFYCFSPIISQLKNKILKVSSENSLLLRCLLNEATNFNKNLGYLYDIEQNHVESVFGAEQKMYIYLEIFLINMIREIMGQIKEKSIITEIVDIKKPNENHLYRSIIEYLNNNIGEKITIDIICKKFFISSTRLKKMFAKELDCGVISYFNEIKMLKAKELIRTNKYSYTEISVMLGFDSIHYFSSCFKKRWSMSPSEYSNSVSNI